MVDDLNSAGLDELFARLVDTPALAALIAAAVREDMGTAGDITSRVTVPPGLIGGGRIVTRRDGRLAGAALLGPIARAYDARLEVGDVVPDGSALKAGDVIATVSGPMRRTTAHAARRHPHLPRTRPDDEHRPRTRRQSVFVNAERGTNEAACGFAVSGRAKPQAANRSSL